MQHFLDLIFRSKRRLLKRLKEKERIVRNNDWLIRTWAHDQAAATNAINSAVQFMNQHPGTISETELALLRAGIQLLQDGATNLIDFMKEAVSTKNEFGDLLEIVQSVISLYSANAKFNQVTVVLQLDSTAPIDFYNDQLMIKRILGNLLSNAIKFSPPGGKVIIRAYGKDGDLYFGVQDSGPGIPQHQQQHIFRPYVKLTEGKSGTGLGLFICRRFARILGGDIHVESTTGTGSVFIVKIRAVNV